LYNRAKHISTLALDSEISAYDFSDKNIMRRE